MMYIIRSGYTVSTVLKYARHIILIYTILFVQDYDTYLGMYTVVCRVSRPPLLPSM